MPLGVSRFAPRKCSAEPISAPLTLALSHGERGLDETMLAKLKTFSLLGIDALPVEVEVDVSPSGLPKVVLVGLPEAAVKESMHRVERALVNSGFQRPQSRVGSRSRSDRV